MELRVLNYFLAVAREQNISAAAEFLHVSQPTLSIQLKDLEDELGKQLLIRGTFNPWDKGKPEGYSNGRRDDSQKAGRRNYGFS